MEIIINFGAPGGTIASQLKKQQFEFDKRQIAYCEKLKTCILHLSASGIITQKESSKHFQRLTNRIKNNLKPLKNK